MTTMQKETIRTFIVIGALVIVGLIGAKLVDRYTATPAPTVITPSSSPTATQQAPSQPPPPAQHSTSTETWEFATNPAACAGVTSTQPESKEWKTFSDERLGFSFDYPTEWEMTSYVTSTVPGLHLRSPEIIRQVQNHEIEGYDIDFAVSVWPDINTREKSGGWIGKRTYKDLEDFIANNTDPSEPSTGTTTIDGLLGHEISVGGNGVFYAVLLERNKLYEFDFISAWDKSCLTLDQKKILSSIRFLK